MMDRRVTATDGSGNFPVTGVSKATEIERLVRAPAPRDEPSDSELIARFLEGSEEAFNRLVLKHQRRAYNIAYRFLAQHEDALEVAQDAFVRVYRNLRRFKGRSSFKTWLYKIILNLARNRYRQRVSRGELKKVSLDNPKQYEDSAGPREIEDRSLSPMREIGGREIGREIQRGLMQLAAEHRQAIILRHIEGLSYAEMAQVLQCAEGTVKSRLHRARLELRVVLRELL
jgi:RNA polymerase sigma-70 factor (ECF subfamily)